MYKPKKHIRLSSLFQAPKLGDIRTLFNEGTKAKGCTVELPWVNKRTGVNYSLTVRAEISGGQPMWTLYEGEGTTSRVVWSSPFEDVDLLYDVLTLSIPEEALPLGTKETAKPDPEKIRQAEERSSVQDANAQLITPKQPASFYEEGLLKEEELETYKRAESKRAAEEEKERRREELLAKERAAREKEKEDKDKDSGKDKPDQAPQAPTPQPGAPYGAPPYPPPYPYYQGYPPGYVPPPYPYYPGYPPGYYPYPGQGPMPPIPPIPPPQPYPAGTVGMGSGQYPIPGQYETAGQLPAFEPQPPTAKVELGLKLGQFLVEAGLVPQPTVDAALQLQDLVRSGKLPTQKAAEAVRRAHIRGGEVDPALTASRDVQTYAVQGNAPPLGQILVEAAILRGPVLRSVLQLQQKVRAGNITQEEAFDVLYKEVFGIGKDKEDKQAKGSEKKPGKELDFSDKESEDALILLKVAGLLSDFDIESARKVAQKHNSNVLKILKTSGKLDEFTVEASVKLAKMVDANKFKPDQAVIALHFCQRSRVSLEDALKELGWQT
ncbi:MAG: hypothetical protein SFY67_05995 [Candidatus Melainabacteria bacterium]|nr:hypothetical protein [Candidatus Melainabacteria bacterium]